MSNDKPWVIMAVVLLAVMGTFAGYFYKSPEGFTTLLDFFKTLALGLFALVTGAAWEKIKRVKKEKEGGDSNG